MKVFNVKMLLAFSILGFGFTALAQPSTAGCNAGVGTGLAVNATCVTSAMNSTGNGDYWNSPSNCNASDNDDVWWWFTAIATSTTITYDPTANNRDPIMHLFTGACSNTMTSFDCVDAGGDGVTETITITTVPGTVYSIRIQDFSSDSNMDGVICATSPIPAPANDEACAATPLANNGTCLAAQTNVGSTIDWFGGCVPTTATTVFYTTTITGANNSLNVSFPANTFGGGNVNVQLLRKNDICPADADMTSFGSYCGAATGAINFNSLVAGTYYIAVSTAPANQGTFTICATQSTIAALADDPCVAPTIASNYCSGATAHTNVGAVSSFANNFFNNNACGDNNQNEVFFKFVATHTSIDITALQGSIGGANSEITILQTTPDDTDCNDLYSIIGFSCPAWGTTASFLNELVVGETYYISIDHNGNNSNEGTFGICLNSYTYTPPAGTGINCASAIPITTPFLDVSTTAGSLNDWNYACDIITGNFVGGAAIDFAIPGYLTEDKFYTITVPAGGGYYDYSLTVNNNSLGVNSEPIVSFITACPTLNQNDFDNASTLCQNLNDNGGDGTNSEPHGFPGGDIPCTGIYLPAGTYYVVIDHMRHIINGGNGAISTIAGVPTSFEYTFEFNELAQATNNECTGAQSIGAGVTQNGNNSGCNYSYGPNDPNSSEFCAFSTENLAWFSFTTAAGQTTVDIALSNVSGDVQWGIVQGPCGGPYTSAGSNALNNPSDGYSSANDPCDRVSTTSYNTTITGLTPNTQYWFVADGNAGTPSSFDITMTNITLPIKYKSFDLKNKINAIHLDWITASENNNDYFTIERSYDGVNFEEIGKLDGSGNSNFDLAYNFIDRDVEVKGKRFYRIKQTDFDFIYSYSEVKSVDLDLTSMALSPNPVVDKLEISLDSYINNSNAILTIYSVSGVLIYSTETKLIKGVNTLVINTEEFNSGLYFVVVETNNEKINERFVKK
jgi:hypothetical protein